MNNYQKYAEIQESIAKLEDMRDSLRQKILEEMQHDKEDTEYGTFTKAHRYTWEYTDKVDRLVEKVKVEQVRQQKNGQAKKKVTEYLRFNPISE